MRKIVYIIVIFLFCSILVFGFLIIKPVPIVAEEKAVVVQGLVIDIYEGGVKDVIFKLNGDNSSYYINRGLESGMDIDDLKEKLIGNTVLLKYHKQSQHIFKLEFNNEILYSEYR